jgi:hypothetical protein
VQVRDLARAAYPIIIKQLTAQGAIEKHTKVDYVHPAARQGAKPGATSGAGAA